ncbi:MAG: leucine-rich repeat protein [Erysipelotrichaceae bacterium]|nr:leucine-rich repeat protein [Erysipelotrichaceae bacterium]
MGILDKLKKKETITEQTKLVPGVGRMPYPAYRGREPYIFISYSHRDSQLVFAEIKRLNEFGYHVWYDEGISPGNEWTDEIAGALEHCALFIVFFTPNSAESDNVQNEIDFALDDKKPCIGVYLKETTLRGRTRLRFGMKQAIMKYSMPEDEYVYKLTSALERMGIDKKKVVPEITPITNDQVKQEALEVLVETNKNVKTPAFALTESDRINIERIQNSEASMQDFEWIGSTVKEYHGIKKRFTVPDRANRLLSYTFKNRDYIEEVILPESVNDLDAHVFINCPNLEMVIIKNSDVHFAEVSPFSNCPKLKVQCHKDSITHVNLKRAFDGSIMFFEDTDQSFTINKETMIETEFEIEYGVLKKYKGNAVSVKIPKGVVKIAGYAFNQCELLEKVELPEKLRSIETAGFTSCPRLQNINIPTTVSYLFSSAFINCPLLVLTCYKKSLSNDFERLFSGLDIVFLDEPST